MQLVPLAPVASQVVSAYLGQQSCTIRAQQKALGLMVDLTVDTTLIIGSAVCQDRNRIVRDAYRGFVGDLVFVDTLGTSDPDYTGIGSRFFLIYLEASDLTA